MRLIDEDKVISVIERFIGYLDKDGGLNNDSD